MSVRGEDLVAGIARSAAGWLDIRGPVAVEIEQEDPRPVATTYVLRVRSSDGQDRRLFAKVARRDPGWTPEGGRPRVVPRNPPDLKRRLEPAALAAAHAHFRSVGDRRFGAVSMLGEVGGAVVLEHVAAPTLHALMRRALLGLPGTDVTAAMRDAGAWLRLYQEGAGPAHVVPRLLRPSDYLELLHRLAGHLRTSGSQATVLDMAERAGAAAAAELPPDLPTGLAHGDFGPHNLFVGQDGRITGFDMLSRWRAVVYEDVAAFVSVLRAGKPMLVTARVPGVRRRCARWEEAFLSGYFGDAPVATTALRFFLLLALLDRWGMVRENWPRGVMRVWADRVLERRVRRVVQEVDEG